MVLSAESVEGFASDYGVVGGCGVGALADGDAEGLSFAEEAVGAGVEVDDVGLGDVVHGGYAVEGLATEHGVGDVGLILLGGGVRRREEEKEKEEEVEGIWGLHVDG